MGQQCCTGPHSEEAQELVRLSEKAVSREQEPDSSSLEELSTNMPSTQTIPCSVVIDNIDNMDGEYFAEDMEVFKACCRGGQVAEALQLFEQLERRANAKDDSRLLSVLHHNPAFQELRDIHKLRDGFLERLVEPAWKEHSEWTFLTLTEPEIDPNFKLTFRMRFARGSERNHAKGGSQIMIGATCVGFPVSLSKLVAYHSRVHRIKKEWLKDCERITGLPATDQNLYTAVLTSLLAPKILPFKLEDVIVRNFIVCKEAPPIPGSRPGVMVMESSPDESLTHLGDMELPKSRRGVIQITGSEKLNHFMPSVVGPNHVDAISSIRAQLPIPQWLLSLELVKRFLADVFSNTLKVIKEQVADDWDNLPFKEDIKADPILFDKVQEITDASTAKLCGASL